MTPTWRKYLSSKRKEGITVPTLYVRTFSLKNSLTDNEVLDYWRFLMDEALPTIQKVKGTRSVKAYSGAGALRADITLLWEMDDASVYERALLDSQVRQLLGRIYGAWNLNTAGQSFRREVTPELLRALSSTG
jgi:hypothetical protein